MVHRNSFLNRVTLSEEVKQLKIIIIIYHDFSLHQGGVVMSGQVKHTHSHQDIPLSPYLDVQ